MSCKAVSFVFRAFVYVARKAGIPVSGMGNAAEIPNSKIEISRDIVMYEPCGYVRPPPLLPKCRMGSIDYVQYEKPCLEKVLRSGS